MSPRTRTSATGQESAQTSDWARISADFNDAAARLSALSDPVLDARRENSRPPSDVRKPAREQSADPDTAATVLSRVAPSGGDSGHLSGWHGPQPPPETAGAFEWLAEAQWGGT